MIGAQPRFGNLVMQLPAAGDSSGYVLCGNYPTEQGWVYLNGQVIAKDNVELRKLENQLGDIHQTCMREVQPYLTSPETEQVNRIIDRHQTRAIDLTRKVFKKILDSLNLSQQDKQKLQDIVENPRYEEGIILGANTPVHVEFDQ